MTQSNDLIEEHNNAIANDILDEAGNQVDKWGVQAHPDGTGGQAAERIAEAAKAACDSDAKFGRTTWKGILDEEVKEAFAESNPIPLRAELIQVAAVALSWVRDIDSRPAEGAPRERHERSYIGPKGVGTFHIGTDGAASLSEELLHDILTRAGYVEAPNA